MSTVALLFERAAPASANLVFGDTGAAAPASEIAISGAFPALVATIRLVPLAELEVVGTFPTLTAQITLVSNVKLSISGAFPVLQSLAEVTYSTNTSRPTVAQVADKAQVATATEGGISQPQQHAQQSNSGTQTVFSDAVLHNAGRSTGFANGLDASSPVHGRFEDAVPVSDSTRTTMQEGDRQWLRFYSQFQEADRVYGRLFGRFEDGVKTPSLTREHRFQDAKKTDAPGYTGHASDATARRKGWQGPFQDARVPPPGIYVLPVLPVIPTFWWTSELLFACPPLEFPNLVFGIYPCAEAEPIGPRGLVIVPVKRVYIVINEASLRRVDGNIQLPTFGMSLSLDMDSWTWGFSATLPAETLANLEPASTGAPVEVEAMINGVPYRALVESISRSRSFGKSGITIQGRGKTALLDTPYSPVSNFTNSGARTAQQIMGDILSVNGVPMDWVINWGLTDWLVPAGVFAHQGSYIGALGRIAESVGAYLQPHASTQSVSVLPRYPSTPWTWGSVTPDFELPSSVTTTEGIAWAEKARYNRVFVSGVQQGVLGQVTRAGTAGDLLAPMITDALITHADAARQRGLSILSNTGRQANVTLKLPVLAETGVITPGKFVRYVDGATTRTGVVRSVGVEVAMPDIFQTLGIETHVN
jgi:hypothetical protein